MWKKQKGFMNVALVFLVIVLAGVLTGVIFFKKSVPTPTIIQAQPISNQPEVQAAPEVPGSNIPAQVPTAASNTVLVFTEADMNQGWYWGDQDQKKAGTPLNWLHSDEGTRSAKWYDPNR